MDNPQEMALSLEAKDRMVQLNFGQPIEGLLITPEQGLMLIYNLTASIAAALAQEASPIVLPKH